MVSQSLLRSILNRDNPVLTKENINKLENEEDRNNALAKWVIEFGFEGIKPQHIPEPPVSLRDYRTEKSRRAAVNQPPLEMGADFWRNHEVATFLDTEARARQSNIDNYNHLKEYIKFLNPGEDDAYIAKFKQRIEEYDEFFGNFGKASLPQEMHSIAKIFNAQSIQEEWE